jgi:hypothetical protein
MKEHPMCRVCEMKEMSREELAAVVEPIVMKVDAGEDLTNDEAKELVAYGGLIEFYLAEAKAQLVAYSFRTAMERALRQSFGADLARASEDLGAGLSGEADAANSDLGKGNPFASADNGEPMGDLDDTDAAAKLRRLLGGLGL